MEHLTPSSVILTELMSIRGNDKCYDCACADNVWASVNMGILLCIDCAGKHRRFGVNVSFVRSLHMDTWSDQQLEMIRQGGNGRLRDFFIDCIVKNKAIEGAVDTKAWEAFYTSDEAERYRVNLKKRATKRLDGASAWDMNKLERSVVEMPNAQRTASEDSIDAELGAEPEQNHSVSMSPSKEEMYDDRATRMYSVTFYTATLGLSLRKHVSANSAFVSHVSSQGQAEAEGVIENDVILSVNGNTMHKYEDVMKAVQRSPRPTTITFMRGFGTTDMGELSLSAKSAKEKAVDKDKDKERDKGRRRSSSASMVGAATVSSASKALGAMSGVKNKPPVLNLPPGNRASPTNGTTTPRSRDYSRDMGQGGGSGKRSGGGGRSTSSVPAASPRTPRKAATTPTSGTGKSPSGSGSKGSSGKRTSSKDKAISSSPPSNSTTPVARRRSSSGPSTPGACAGASRAYSSEKGTKSTPKSGNNSAGGMKKKDNAGKATSSSGGCVGSRSLSRLNSADAENNMVGGEPDTADVWAFHALGAGAEESALSRGTPSFSSPARKETPSPCSLPLSPLGEDCGLGRRSSNSSISSQLPREFRAVFTKAPLGLTLRAQSGTGLAWVSNIVPDGQAEILGVEIGDNVVGIESDWMGSYDEVMRALPSQKYPFAFVFRRTLDSPRNSLASLPGLG